MNFTQLVKKINADRDMGKLVKKLKQLSENGIPADRQMEVAKNRADFELKKNDLIRETMKKEIEILKR